jgi:hypothetical protein
MDAPASLAFGSIVATAATLDRTSVLRTTQRLLVRAPRVEVATAVAQPLLLEPLLLEPLLLEPLLLDCPPAPPSPNPLNRQ